MNDLELYREELANCDAKITEALKERYAIIEKIMQRVMYEVPGMKNVKTCRITEDVVLSGKEPLLECEEAASSGDSSAQ